MSLMPPLSKAERIVRDRMNEGNDRPTVQVNLTFSLAERDRLDRLAEDLEWSMRKVVATALQVLEATMEELKADEYVSGLLETKTK